jgi:hypothetical protein
MARVLRVQNKVFYTIGSSGHEGNAMVARLTRHTDPAFLHYRSGAFMAERFRKLPGMDPIMDSALSFAASKDDPASGGRHKVWGSKPLWVLPQTSTIASHLPKAWVPRSRSSRRTRIGHACRFRRFHRDLFVRRCLVQPCHRADRIQCGGLDGLPEAARAGAVRVRGQRHRHLGEDADGAGSAKASREPPRPRLFLRGRPRPGQGYARCSARSSTADHAPSDLPASAHHPHHGPRRHRLRDRVAQHRGTGAVEATIRCCARPRSRWNPG